MSAAPKRMCLNRTCPPFIMTTQIITSFHSTLSFLLRTQAHSCWQTPPRADGGGSGGWQCKSVAFMKISFIWLRRGSWLWLFEAAKESHEGVLPAQLKFINYWHSHPETCVNRLTKICRCSQMSPANKWRVWSSLGIKWRSWFSMLVWVQHYRYLLLSVVAMLK